MNRGGIYREHPRDNLLAFYWPGRKQLAEAPVSRGLPGHFGLGFKLRQHRKLDAQEISAQLAEVHRLELCQVGSSLDCLREGKYAGIVIAADRGGESTIADGI